MSVHTNIRLEASDGTPIAYFAPEFEVNTTTDNDLNQAARPREEPSIARDSNFISMEVSVQGEFVHSSTLPDAHVADLESMLGHSAPITAREQVNRIRRYVQDRPLLSAGIRAEPLHFYDNGDAYANETAAAIDWQAGDYPPVAISKLSPIDEPGAGRYEYTVKLQVGTPTGVYQ